MSTEWSRGGSARANRAAGSAARGPDACSTPGRPARRFRFRRVRTPRCTRDAYGSLVPRRNARRRRRRRTVTERFRNVSRSGPTGTVEPATARAPAGRARGGSAREKRTRTVSALISGATLQGLTESKIPGRSAWAPIKAQRTYVSRRGVEGPTHRRAVGTRSGFRFRAVDSTPAA